MFKNILEKIFLNTQKKGKKNFIRYIEETGKNL